MIVLKEDPKILLNKFLKGLLYTLLVFLVSLAINAVTGGGLPPQYSVYASLIYNLLVIVKKGLETYKPEYAEKFEWFFVPFVKAIFEFITNKKE